MRLRRRSHVRAALAMLALAGATVAPAAPAWAQNLRFAALGDLPYTEAERRQMPAWFGQIAAAQPAFAIHVGDFKFSRTPCTDEVFADRFALFDASPVPLIYTPGDNEWTDCRLLSAGSHDPVERLNKLRQVFFARPESLGRKRILVQSQPGAPENVRWRAGGLVFATINVPAGNNFGFTAESQSESRQREPVILDWLRQAFGEAQRSAADGVVIAFQANPGFELLRKGIPAPGFRALLATLQAEAASFAKPVLLIHGDTHTWRFDQALVARGSTQSMPKVWRIEVPGTPNKGWVEVEFRRDDATNPFSARMHPFDGAE
jgi:hypothetical protein